MQKTIGFIDYFLDEWHANNYPNWIDKQAENRFKVTNAWAAIDSPKGGNTSEDWCDLHNVKLLTSAQDVVDNSDCIVVLSPDNPEQHETLTTEALRSGKRVYVDKTFAPNLASARRMIALAYGSNTPMFTSSALRYAKEVCDLCDRFTPKDIALLTVAGPGSFENYAIHQVEMIVSVMGTGIKRLISVGTSANPVIAMEYADGRKATMTQSAALGFSIMACPKEGEPVFQQIKSDFFQSFIEDMLSFFDGNASSVSTNETLQVAAILDAASTALTQYGEWIPVKNID